MNYRKLLYAASSFARDLQTHERSQQALTQAADGLLDADELSLAEEQYQQLLKLDPTGTNSRQQLARLYLAQGRYGEASLLILEAIEREPLLATLHADFGTIAANLGDRSAYDRLYLQVVGNAIVRGRVENCETEHPPSPKTWADVENLLESLRRASPEDSSLALLAGHLALAQGQTHVARETYRALHAQSTEEVRVAESLATVLTASGELGQAAEVLGDAYFAAERYRDAEASFRGALAHDEGNAKVYRRLAYSLYRQDRHEEAVDVCRKGTQVHRSEPWLYTVWIWSLEQLSRVEELIAVGELAADRLNDPTFMSIKRKLVLPVIYRSEQEILDYRSRYTEGLSQLAEEVRLADHRELVRLGESIDPNFYLGYQAFSTLDLQRVYGQICHYLMSSRFPAWAGTRSLPALVPGERLRIGYFSRHLREHTVAKLFLGWLTHHDRAQFEVFCYHTGRRVDLMSREFERNSDHFFHLTVGTQEICEQIDRDRLHVLVFLDIGMDAKTTKIASLRLAPVQCAVWGHPVTTGLPTIDYFLSSDLMEPEGGDEHYSEELIRLPGIGVCVPPLYLPTAPKTRQDFGLPEDAVLYAAGQSLFKYLPQYDFIFPAIAALVPKALFVFLSNNVEEVTALLEARLRESFAAAGMDASQHILFHERVSSSDYIELLRVCDVFLDSIGWSGGMTTLEAVGCSLPIVTLPGDLMRGRHTYAILRQMEVTETVAGSLEEYVDLAVRLGLDLEWRSEVRSRVLAGQVRLFDDLSSIHALEAFYRHVVRGAPREASGG